MPKELIRKLVEGARNIASEGDRWFVSIARSVGRVGRNIEAGSVQRLSKTRGKAHRKLSKRREIKTENAPAIPDERADEMQTISGREKEDQMKENSFVDSKQPDVIHTSDAEQEEDVSTEERPAPETTQAEFLQQETAEQEEDVSTEEWSAAEPPQTELMQEETNEQEEDVFTEGLTAPETTRAESMQAETEEASFREDVTENEEEEIREIEGGLAPDKEPTPEHVMEAAWREEAAADEPDELLVDVETLLKQHPHLDQVDVLRLSIAMDELVNGAHLARRNAQKSLVAFGRVAELFLIASCKSATPEVAEIALEGLAQIGSERFIECTSQLLQAHNVEMRLAAVRTAQKLTDDDVRPLFAVASRDPSAKVRRRMVTYLSWRDASWALAELRRLCNDPDPVVKWAALESLACSRPAAARELLKRTTSPQEEAYRRRVLLLLERQESPESLNSSLPQSTDPETPMASPSSVKEEKKGESKSEDADTPKQTKQGA